MKKYYILMILFLIFALKVEAGDEVVAEVFIDVRTVEEYKSGHIENAVNIPHNIIKDKIAAVTQDKNSVIKLYCQSGNRAGIAKKILEELGYKNVVNEGGYKELKKRLGKKEK